MSDNCCLPFDVTLYILKVAVLKYSEFVKIRNNVKLHISNFIVSL